MGVFGLDTILYKLIIDMKTKNKSKNDTEEEFTAPTEAEAWAIILAIFILRIVMIYLLVPFAWNSSIAPAINANPINGLEALGFAIFLEMLI